MWINHTLRKSENSFIGYVRQWNLLSQNDREWVARETMKQHNRGGVSDSREVLVRAEIHFREPTAVDTLCNLAYNGGLYPAGTDVDRASIPWGCC